MLAYSLEFVMCQNLNKVANGFTCRAWSSISNPLVLQQFMEFPSSSVGVVAFVSMCQCDSSRNFNAISARSATCWARVQRTRQLLSFTSCQKNNLTPMKNIIIDWEEFYLQIKILKNRFYFNFHTSICGENDWFYCNHNFKITHLTWLLDIYSWSKLNQIIS